MYLLYLRTSMRIFNDVIITKYSRSEITEFKRLSEDRCEFLYAWTKSKKYLKMFFEARDENKFRVKKVSNDEIKYHEILHPNLKLIKTSLDDDTSIEHTEFDHIEVILTVYEDTVCTEECDKMHDYIADNFSTYYSDYYILTNKYIEVLSKLGYCQLYDMLISGDGVRIEYADNNESYKIQSDIVGVSSNKSVYGQIISEFANFIMTFNFTC